MLKILPLAAVLAMFLAATNAVEARGGHSGSAKGSSKAGQGKMNPGKSNPGKGMSSNHKPNHTHPRGYNRFSHRYWNSRYGCEYCWSGEYGCYFYFYAPAGCYYPVSCIDEYPPSYPDTAPTAAPVPFVQIVNTNQNTLANSGTRMPVAP